MTAEVCPRVPQAAKIRIVRTPELARPVPDRPVLDRQPLRHHQGRQIAVHVIKVRKLQEGVAAEGPDAASRIRVPVAQDGAPHPVGDPGSEFLPAESTRLSRRPCTSARSPGASARVSWPSSPGRSPGSFWPSPSSVMMMFARAACTPVLTARLWPAVLRCPSTRSWGILFLSAKDGRACHRPMNHRQRLSRTPVPRALRRSRKRGTRRSPPRSAPARQR